MSRTSAIRLGGFLIIFIVVLAGASLARGGFFIGKHEGDTLHLLQIVMREAGGEWPHLHFQTPIGLLATMPVAWFVKMGYGTGHAILYAQILVAVAALPAIWWVSASRFRGAWGAVFGGLVLVLFLALVHGEAERSVSISMHYNRWAWGFAFLAIAAAILPARGGWRSGTADGLVIGLSLAVLALTKVTYFAAFVIPVAVALGARGAWRSFGVAVAAGLAVAALVTVVAGTPLFWLAYLRDLLTVSASEVRSYPGLSFPEVVVSPAYMGGSLVLIGAVILLRQARLATEGLVLLLLMPGFFYVQYQNWGNDPQWMGLLALILVASRPAETVLNGWGWDVTKGLTLAAAAAFAFAAPSAINLAYSPFRHLAPDTEDYVPLVPGVGVHADLQTLKVRALQFDIKQPMDLAGSPFAAYSDPELRELTEWRGETLPECEVKLGTVAWFHAISDDLKASGLTQGHTVFVADILSSFWLFGAFEPLPGASPWYYGGLPGIDAADFLLVPECVLSTKVRRLVLAEVEEADLALTEVRRNEMYRLYSLD